ncbi:MAG: trypsin-like peptidase domain-containing protein [Oscillospiraceae bacterium]|nr:trypsin-like peptidase domain-containing protein [Oscillospiraceae bacterium]
MSNNNWYSAESWYAPLQPERTEAEVKPQKRGAKRPRLSSRWRIGIGAALVVGLIVLSSLVFSQPEPVMTDGLIGDEMPEDWHDYFDSFYTNVEGLPEESRIERAASVPDFELEFSEAGGKVLSLQELYEKCAKYTVSIMGYKTGEDGYFWGTGVILSENGLIVTNSHIISDCDTATVVLHDDREFEAKLVGFDSISDVAVLKIEAKGLPAAEFGDSAGLMVGDRVAAIGNPLGEEFRMTLTDGIVSAIERGIDYNGHSMSLIQTNTALNEGNSGGALFNMYGQVIGITNMKMMSTYSSIEGIGFAIPSATVKNVVASLIEHGEVRGRPSLGLTVGPIMEQASEHYDIPGGLYVTAVSEGSDAEAKGVLAGDIILTLNGEEVHSTDDILSVKNELEVGDSMHFSIWREGEVYEVDIVLVDTNDIY